MPSEETQRPVLENNFHEQLEAVGDNPRYIWKLFFICMLPSILNGLNVTSYVYLTDVPEHWCSVPVLKAAGWTPSEIRQITSPNNSSGSTCKMRNLNYEALSNMSFKEALDYAQNADTDTVPCAEHYLADNVPSMVYDFDLVCENTALKSSIQVAISLGKFLGAFIFGIVSDRFGRRTSFFCGSILYILSGPLIAFANSYVLIIIGRIGLGAAGSGIYHSAFVILSEIASKRRRGFIGIVYNMSYPIGQMAIPIIAYFIRDWRVLQIIISVPALATLFFYWLLPESPLWLVSNHREDEAAKFLKKEFLKLKISERARIVKVPDEVQVPKVPLSQITDKQTFMENVKRSLHVLTKLLVHSELRHRLLITIFVWCVCSFSYYGIALNVDNFGIDRYVYGFLTGLVEAPSYLLPLPLLRMMGRKLTSVILFYIAGFSLLGILLLPEVQGLNVALLTVASIGRLCVSGVFAVVILHCTELFPTLQRNTAIGLGSTSSHIGSMSAPLFVDLLGAKSRMLPSTVFGGLTLVAGTLVFLLPETKDKPLPNNIQDVVKAPKEARCGLHQFCLH